MEGEGGEGEREGSRMTKENERIEDFDDRQKIRQTNLTQFYTNRNPPPSSLPASMRLALPGRPLHEGRGVSPDLTWVSGHVPPQCPVSIPAGDVESSHFGHAHLSLHGSPARVSRGLGFVDESVDW